jgi:hypothetical protein
MLAIEWSHYTQKVMGREGTSECVMGCCRGKEMREERGDGMEMIK